MSTPTKTPASWIINGDVIEKSSLVKDGSQKLILSSPPYNIGKEYEKKVSLEQYMDWQKRVIAAIVPKLTGNGSICWQVGNYVNDGEVFPLDFFFYDALAQAGLKFRNRMIWQIGHGLHCTKRFSGRHETILWFSKSDKFTYNERPADLSKDQSDVWDVMDRDWESLVWEIPNVKHNHPEKTDHPCQFPVELAERCILKLTNEGDSVFDPFSGSGQTMIAANKNNRDAVGIDLTEKYCQDAKNRLVLLSKGELKTRPMTRKIYTGKKQSA